MNLNNEDKKIYQTLKDTYNISYKHINKDFKLINYPVEYSYYLAITYIEKYYESNNDVSYNLEDYFHECIIAITEAYQKYNNKYSFKIFVERYITSHLAKVFNKKVIPEESLDDANNEYIIDDYAYNLVSDNILKEHIYNLIFNTEFTGKNTKIYNYLKTDRNLDILKMHFGFDEYSPTKTKDIAKKYNISCSRVNQIIKEICQIYIKQVNEISQNEFGKSIYILRISNEGYLEYTITPHGMEYYNNNFSFDSNNLVKARKKSNR